MTVVRAKKGDLSAFETLYRDNVGRIFALCLRMTGDRTEAEELTQEAFVRAWRKIGSFRGESAFSSWLYRLAVNVVLSDRRARRSNLLRMVPEDAAPPDQLPRLRPLHGLGIDLDRAIGELPDGARRVFVLHEVEGYSHEEIAGLLGVAVGTCKAQLHRARKLLREALRS